MLAVKDIERHFVALRHSVPLGPVRSAEQHDALVSVMNALMDNGAADEQHPLADLLALIGKLVADYEDVYLPRPQVPAPEVIRQLMAQHGLRQRDLPEIGSQGVVSEILNGKRSLNVRQIQSLSQRFGVDPTAFL